MESFSSNDHSESYDYSDFCYDLDPTTTWMEALSHSGSLEPEYQYYGHEESQTALLGTFPSAHLQQFDNQPILPQNEEDTWKQPVTETCYSASSSSPKALVSTYDSIENYQSMTLCHAQSVSAGTGIFSPMVQSQETMFPQHDSYDQVKPDLYINTSISGTSPLESPLSEDTITTGTLSLPTPLLPSQKTFEIVEQEFECFLSELKLEYPGLAFMPQKIYQSHAKADLERYVKDAKLQPPILFHSKTDHCGVRLRDVLCGGKSKHSELLKLVNPTELVLDHGPPSTSIRLQVPGYKKKKGQKRQISLRTYEKEKKPLNRERLLSAVARAIKHILENLAQETQDDNEVVHLFPRWTIGNGAKKIGFDDLCIISLHNVSQGTWQPHLYLDPESPLYGHGRY